MFVTDLVMSDKPVLFWENNIDKFVIGTEVSANSGRVAITRMSTPSGDIGKPMNVRFICARKADIDAWKLLINSDPFATTLLSTEFVTGKLVIFRYSETVKPIVYDNMILKDKNYDIEQDIFDSGHADYKKGFDFWHGYLNLMIAG